MFHPHRSKSVVHRVAVWSAAIAVAALCLALGGHEASRETVGVIVQGSGVDAVRQAVESVGGEVTHELGIIRAVAARVTAPERGRLEATAGLRVYDDAVARAASVVSLLPWAAPSGGNQSPHDTVFPTQVGAARLHDEGLTGAGVTVAVLDSGSWAHKSLAFDSRGTIRALGGYDAIDNLWMRTPRDDFGHGTHITSIITSSAAFTHGKSRASFFNGMAPDADVISVRAFDANGAGTYGDVIRGLDWIVANRDSYGIRVVNLSFSAPPRSFYWDDPLNQAVMATWQAGIVLVASAGNTGPEAMSIGVPGNVPYIITVGAMSDGVTPAKHGDDFLTTFSSAGPTYEGFVKPELVAPGGHVMGLMEKSDTLVQAHPEFHFDENFFIMSGTSQAAAVVTGAVALLLEAEPWLTPDEVKCRLIDGARPAMDPKTKRFAYSVFQQGAGMVDAWRAVTSSASACANRGLDVASDLAGKRHFGGRADRTADGTYYLRGLEGDGYAWSDGYAWNDSFVWSDNPAWTAGHAWSDSFIWNDGSGWLGNGVDPDGFVWNDSFIWNDSHIWNDSFIWNDAWATPMSVNSWVEQQ